MSQDRPVSGFVGAQQLPDFGCQLRVGGVGGGGLLRPANNQGFLLHPEHGHADAEEVFHLGVELVLPLAQVAKVVQLMHMVLKTALKHGFVGIVEIFQAFAEQRVGHRVQPRLAVVEPGEDALLKRAQLRGQLLRAEAPKPLLQAALVLRELHGRADHLPGNKLFEAQQQVGKRLAQAGNAVLQRPHVPLPNGRIALQFGQVEAEGPRKQFEKRRFRVFGRGNGFAQALRGGRELGGFLGVGRQLLIKRQEGLNRLDEAGVRHLLGGRELQQFAVVVEQGQLLDPQRKRLHRVQGRVFTK